MFYKLEQIVFCSLSLFLATGCSVKDDSYEYSYEYNEGANSASNSYYTNSTPEKPKTSKTSDVTPVKKEKVSSSSDNMTTQTMDTVSANSEVVYVHETNKHTKKPYEVLGKKYTPMEKAAVGHKEHGIASWYGAKFNNKKTSSGEIYDMYQKTAAHKTLPMGTIVKVTNKDNGKSTIVKINDRGPFVENRIIDLSYVAGKEVGIDVTGTAPATIEVLGKDASLINDVSEAEMSDKKVISSDNSDASSMMYGAKAGYYVQVGAFSKIEGAKIYQNKYSTFGNKVYIKKYTSSSGRLLYKVLIGDLNSYKEAVKFKSEHDLSESFVYRVK
jgi:rare lipoprotein A